MSGIVGGNRVPNDVAAMLRRIEAQNQQMRTEHERMRNDLADAQARLATALGQMRTPEAIVRPRTIAEIPGPRSLRMYVLRIPFAAGETAMQQASVEISTDGPFIVTDVTVGFQVDDTVTPAPAALQKRMIPATSYWPAVYQAGATTATNMGLAALQYYPELWFQIRVDGSGRYWTNNPMPASAFASWSAPKFAGIETWVESKNRLIIEATPQYAMPLAGVCVFVFNGYQILGNISIAEILGYAA